MSWGNALFEHRDTPFLDVKRKMKSLMHVRGHTYPYPKIFMTFLNESELPHFQKSGGVFTPHTPPVAPPLNGRYVHTDDGSWNGSWNGSEMFMSKK